MPCDKQTPVVTSLQSKNFIYETVKRIDQLQKEVLLENTCIGCEGSLFSRLYNTKPVAFTLCGGELFTAVINATQTTQYFRIQELKGNCVILQLLDYTTTTPTCTSNTCILNLDCCCGMQCFTPIQCATTCPGNNNPQTN